MRQSLFGFACMAVLAGCGSSGQSTTGTGGGSVVSTGTGGRANSGGAVGQSGGSAAGGSGGTLGGSGGDASGTGGTDGTGGTGGAVGTPDAGADVTLNTGTGGAPSDGPTAPIDVATGGNQGSNDAARGDSATGPVDGTGSGGIGAGGSGGATVGTGTSSAGCGINTTPPNPTVQQTMQVNGTTRYYLLTVPSGYSSTKPMPLLFGFHGRNGNNVWVSRGNDWYGHFNLQGATGGQAILVFPQGSGDPPGNSTTLNGTSGWNDNDADLGFFDALLADIKSKYCIDTSRIFATGYSMGGAFSDTLACKRPADLRGIAPIAGWGPNSAPTSGTPSCPGAKGDKGVMGMHGTKDGTIPYAIGQASAEFWRQTNGCSATTASSSAYPSCVAYQGCPAGKEVFFCTHSGDHQVPANAGTNLWKFFTTLH